MSTEKGWDYNAPQYFDFINGQLELEEDDCADDYFDFDHENGIPVNTEDEADNSLKSEVRLTRSSSKKRTVIGNGTPKAGKLQRATRSMSNIGNGTPKAGTPQRATRSMAKTENGTPKAGTPQRVARSKSNVDSGMQKAGTPQRAARSNSSVDNGMQKAGSPVRVARSKSSVGSGTQKAGTPQRAARSKSSVDNGMQKAGSPQRAARSKSSVDSGTQKAGTPQRAARSKSSVGNGTPKARTPQRVERSKSFMGNGTPKASTPKSGNLKRAASFRSKTEEEQNKQAARNICTDLEEWRKKTSGAKMVYNKEKPIKAKPQGPVKSSEEIEMEKISYFRQELAKKRKIAQESCKKALSGKVQSAQMQAKELTKAESFKFETDSRIKSHGMETRHDTSVKDFASILRSDKGKQPTCGIKSSLTKPEPFKLSAQRKRKLPDLDEKQAEKYETMAEKLAQFTKTPERFRSKSKAGPSIQKRGRSKSPPHGVTIPKTPRFETISRSRPVTAPTREDIEKKEYEEMQKNQFKAHPVNQKIFRNPSIKRVPTKTATVPKEFHLTAVRKPHEEDQPEEHYEFHAQPLNKKILEGVVGVKEPKRVPPTVPESPAFTLKHRARIPVVEEPQEKPKPISRPVAYSGIPFNPHLEPKTTEPAPFGFEERDKWKAEEKKRKIEQALEEEKKLREFHANPIPDLKPHLPPKKTKAPTVLQPFNLDTDARGAKKAEEWTKKMQEELEMQKEKVNFKAKDATVLEHEPFVPNKENKYTKDISEFEFNTAKRVVKREAFEMHVKAKEDRLCEIRLQEQKMKEAEEQAKIEKMRKEAVHKANPVKQYKEIVIASSSKPLTEPRSPKFQTDTRLRLRSHYGESNMSS